jgi:dihydrofolate reductase
MRKVTYGAACSLDLYITGPNGDMSWLRWGDEAAAYMTEYWATIDTVVMGRKTYEVARAQSAGDKSSYPGVTTYVCSRTLKPGEDEGVEVISRDAAELIRELKAKPGKDICIMGGGELGSSLLDSGVVDEVGLNIHPILLGSGVPLFRPMMRQIELELAESKVWTNGCVLVTYRVKA